MSTIGIIFLCILQTLVGCISYPDSESSFEIRMELPASCEGDCIIEYSGYIVSYDEASRIPLWVAYELTAEETYGTASRDGKDFRPDENENAIQADDYDFRGSGWTRGHMAPAGDFQWDDLAMWDTFNYTNCCPQDEKLNNGSWNTLENRVRNWARQFGSVFVVTGPIIGQNQGGRIGPHRVVVPDAFFKAILAYSNESYHGIAFVMFNNSTTQRLSDSYLSINDLEEITDIDFFPELDDSIEEDVEGVADLKFWRIQ